MVTSWSVNLRIPLKYLLLVAVLPVCPQVYSQSTDCLTVATVITVVGRRDKDGASPIASLRPENLRAKVGGENVSIESVAHPLKPLRVSIVLDIGSSQSKSTWDAARLIIHNFPSHFLEGTEFSLVAFDDRVEQKFSLQPGSYSLDQFVDALSPSKTKESKTGLYEGVAEGIRTLGMPQPGDVVFLVTSWEDAGKSDAQTAIVQSLSVAGVRLFGISLDSPRHSDSAAVPRGTPSVSLTSLTPIEAVAKSSGGLWIRASGSGPVLGSLPKMSAPIVEDLYTVRLKLAKPLVKAQQMRIEFVKGSQVSLKPNLSPNDVMLSYPQALYPCR